MITVFGSINLDLVVRAPHLPQPGETVVGGAFAAHPGGKGANQALAARRAGADVRLIGAVGDDSFAVPALALLTEGGVDLTGVRTLSGAATGVALIAVAERTAENQILVASGANALVRAQDLPKLGPKDWLLMQGELDLAESLTAATLARQAGATVIWNLAPVPPQGVPADLAAWLDLLIVNAGEAAALTGAGTAEAALAAWPGDMVITLGATGAIARLSGDTIRAPAQRITPVDTTGAGDATVGALLAALSQGTPALEALTFGLTAGSLACLAQGAQPSFATRAAIEAFRAKG